MNLVWAALVLLVVVLGLRFLNRRLANRRRAALDTLAAQLGLDSAQFDPLGGAVTPRSPSAPGSASPPHQRRLAEAMTTAWGTRKELRGQWNGRAVSIGVLPVRRYRKAIAAQCHLPREVGLWAHPTRKPIAEPPAKTTVVRSGDAVFDAAIRVAARDAASAERLLSRPEFREALGELARLEAAFVHQDWVYVAPYDDVLEDLSAVRRLLDQVSALAARLDRAIDAVESAH